jgi:hypothetical protein
VLIATRDITIALLFFTAFMTIVPPACFCAYLGIATPHGHELHPGTVSTASTADSTDTAGVAAMAMVDTLKIGCALEVEYDGRYVPSDPFFTLFSRRFSPSRRAHFLTLILHDLAFWPGPSSPPSPSSSSFRVRDALLCRWPPATLTAKNPEAVSGTCESVDVTYADGMVEERVAIHRLRLPGTTTTLAP